MVSGQPVLGSTVTAPRWVWYINLEGPADEIERRFAAAAKFRGIDPDIMNQNLFVDSGRDQDFVVLKNAGKGARIGEPVVKSLIQEMVDNRIDVLIVDPFISTHEVEENDNGKIQQVGGTVRAGRQRRQRFRRIGSPCEQVGGRWERRSYRRLRSRCWRSQR